MKVERKRSIWANAVLKTGLYIVPVAFIDATCCEGTRSYGQRCGSQSRPKNSEKWEGRSDGQLVFYTGNQLDLTQPRRKRVGHRSAQFVVHGKFTIFKNRIITDGTFRNECLRSRWKLHFPLYTFFSLKKWKFRLFEWLWTFMPKTGQISNCSTEWDKARD